MYGVKLDPQVQHAKSRGHNDYVNNGYLQILVNKYEMDFEENDPNKFSIIGERKFKT